MRGQEGGEEPDIALDALVGVQRLVDVARLDVFERRRRHVGMHDDDLGLRLELGGHRAFGRAGFRDPDRAEVRVRLDHGERRLVGLVRVLVGRLAADQLHVGIVLGHVVDEGGDAEVVVALAGVLEHRVLALAAEQPGDLLGRVLGLGEVVRGDVGDALRLRRVGGEGDDRDAAFDGPVDRLDEGIGLHRVQQDALRLLDEVLLEGGDLLGDVVVGRAREDHLAAHRLGGLLEALEHRHPVGVGRDHHVHDVGVARCAGELALGEGRGLRSAIAEAATAVAASVFRRSSCRFLS